MEQTPLFQLNLMLWMVWPQMPTQVLNSVFRSDGFELRAISPRITLPLEVRARARSAAVPIPCKDLARPELLLQHQHRSILLLIECKLSGFGPDLPAGADDHQCIQAATLLCATGPMVAGQWGWRQPGSWQSHLIYAVGAGDEAGVQQTLHELSSRLRAAQLQVAASSGLGVEGRDDGIYLRLAPGSQVPVGPLQHAGPDGIRVMATEPGEDVTPLYLVPWDPSIRKPSEYEERMLQERIRSALAALIGRRADRLTFSLTQDDIMEEVFEIWSLWQDESRARLRQVVMRHARTIFRRLRDLGLGYTEDSARQAFHFRRETSTATRDVRKFLSSRAFLGGEVELEPKPLQGTFEELSPDW